MLRTRFSAVFAVPAICLTVQWAAPCVAAQDEMESARGCSGVTAQVGSGGDFPEPEVRTAARGVLKTTLHACIGRNTIVDQPSGETRVISDQFWAAKPATSRMASTRRTRRARMGISPDEAANDLQDRAPQ